LTKKEACDLLSISPKTLERRMKAGVYKFSRNGSGQYSELSFTHADLGLSEPVPVPTPEPVPVPTPVPETAPAVPEPTPEPKSAPAPLGPIEQQCQSDLAFAEAYKRGVATDSAGNKIDGSNAERPTLGQTSLLGPSIDAKQRPAVDTQHHMNPALIGAPDAINAPRHPFDRGLSDEDLAAARSDWRRRHGGPSMSEQREAIERSKANINAAFDYARGRYSR